MQWGIAGPWYGEFMTLDRDRLMAQMKFLAKCGLSVMGVGITEVAKWSDEYRGCVFQFVADHDLRLAPHAGFKTVGASQDEIQRQTEEQLDALRRHLPHLRGTITNCGAGAGHRFDRAMPLEQKLETISRGLAGLARGCQELGAPLCIENHGDFYCSDLVQLCRMTPGLFLFLDTGNTYLIGERPLPAFEVAAPLTIGTHFKDHLVQPCYDPLRFEIFGAVLGEGDVGLRECYDLLLRKAPDPKNLVMQMEMICPKGMPPLEAMEKSIAFIHSLPEPK